MDCDACKEDGRNVEYLKEHESAVHVGFAPNCDVWGKDYGSNGFLKVLSEGWKVPWVWDSSKTVE